MKNTTKKNKTVAKKAAVAATVANDAPVAVVSVAPVAVAPVVAASVAPKRPRGRPFGSNSLSLVSLASLASLLPANSQLPLSNTLIRSLNSLGLKIASIPFKASELADIQKTYKASIPATNTKVIDLNETPEVTV